MSARPLVTLLLLCSLAGCRVADIPPPARLEEVIARDPVLGRLVDAEVRVERAPFRLAVAPIVRSYDPEQLFANNPSKHASLPDLHGVRGELVDTIRRLGLFERVTSRGESTLVDPGRVVRQAWSEGDDLILELTLRSYYQEYMGHSNYLWWFICYAMYVWPAWYVPVDYYGVGLEVHARLRSVQERVQPLFERTYVVRPSETKTEHTPFDRGLAGFLDLGALWNVETSLEESNWAEIDGHVGPYAVQRLQIQLLQDLEREVRRPYAEGTPEERARVVSRVAKRFAIVVGVSNYVDPALGTAPHAIEDAQGLATFFQTSRGGGLVEGQDLTVLLGPQATGEAILDAVATVSSQATASDEVILYFAGLGASLPLEQTAAPPSSTPFAALGGGALAGLSAASARAWPVLLPQDASAQDVAGTGIGLATLGDRLRGIPAARLVAIFATSFAGARSGARTFRAEGDTTPRGVDLARSMGLGPGRVGIFAARADQAARHLPDTESGLFTHVLLTGLQGAADEDDDTRVALDELCRYVQIEVASRAGLEGFDQEPLVLGLDPTASTLTWPR